MFFFHKVAKHVLKNHLHDLKRVLLMIIMTASRNEAELLVARMNYEVQSVVVSPASFVQ